jgi:myosin heavy subunit
MSALEIRRAGYPTRMTYREFVNQFRVFDVSSKHPLDLPDVSLNKIELVLYN